MPKVNVYLSDELAEAVREAKIPVSSVCQRALEEALQSVAALRESGAPAPGGVPAGLRLTAPVTPRLATALGLAYQASADAGHGVVSTGHLLLGMLAERDNLGVRVLGDFDIEADDLRTELLAALGQAQPGGPGELAATDGTRAVVELMSEEAVRLGHGYLGCEHLLLAVVAEKDDVGGRVLRSMGVDLTVTRRLVRSALTGFVHARANPAPKSTIEATLAAITDRLARIEARLAPST